MLQPDEIKTEVLDVLERSLAQSPPSSPSNSNNEEYEIELKFEDEHDNAETAVSSEKASLPQSSVYYQPVYYTFQQHQQQRPDYVLRTASKWENSPTMLSGAPTMVNIPPMKHSYGQAMYINSPSMVFLSQAAPPQSPHSLNDLKFQDELPKSPPTKSSPVPIMPAKVKPSMVPVKPSMVPVRESLTHQLQQLKEKQKFGMKASPPASEEDRKNFLVREVVGDKNVGLPPPTSMVSGTNQEKMQESNLSGDLMRRWSADGPPPNNGEEQYHCKYCDKNFTRSWNYRRHLLIHTGEKPHKCTVCEKAFVLAAHLKIHMRVHTGEKPYECSRCGHCFAQLTNLQRHMLTHTGVKPFKCKVCGKGFVSSSDLRRHVRIHTGEKPYKCDECSKAFTTSGNLASHKLTHAGLKPFSCKVCSWKFISSSNHRTHMKTRHPEVPVHEDAFAPRVECTTMEAVERMYADKAIRNLTKRETPMNEGNQANPTMMRPSSPVGADHPPKVWPMSDRFTRYPYGEESIKREETFDDNDLPTMTSERSEFDMIESRRNHLLPINQQRYMNTAKKQDTDFLKARKTLQSIDRGNNGQGFQLSPIILEKDGQEYELLPVISNAWSCSKPPQLESPAKAPIIADAVPAAAQIAAREIFVNDDAADVNGAEAGRVKQKSSASSMHRLDDSNDLLETTDPNLILPSPALTPLD